MSGANNKMKSGIILEGVPGAGKTETLKALQAHPTFWELLGEGRVFMEEETLGNLAAVAKEVRSLTSLDKAQLNRRMRQVIEEIVQEPCKSGLRYGYVLERFHPSYFAVVPRWELYQEIDDALYSLGCKFVLLHYDPSKVEQGFRESGDGQAELTSCSSFGGATAPDSATYQEQLRACLQLSKLPTMVIDTTQAAWHNYAAQVLSYWR